MAERALAYDTSLGKKIGKEGRLERKTFQPRPVPRRFLPGQGGILEPKSPTGGAHIPQGWACTAPSLSVPSLPPTPTQAQSLAGKEPSGCTAPGEQFEGQRMSVTELQHPEV